MSPVSTLCSAQNTLSGPYRLLHRAEGPPAPASLVQGDSGGGPSCSAGSFLQSHISQPLYWSWQTHTERHR